MGLDIFVYKVSNELASKNNVSIDSDYETIREMLNNDANIDFERKTQKLLKKLRKEYSETDNYIEVYKNFIKSLKKQVKYFDEYDYNLKQLGYNYLKQEVEQTKTPDEVEKYLETFKSHIYKISDAYFRKVNFLYAYFANKLVNESCNVCKEDIKQLIDICSDVLKNKSDKTYALKHLPTRSGFFFGNIDYNDWYYEQVKDCIKQMKKLYKSLKDDDFVIWDFSW